MVFSVPLYLDPPNWNQHPNHQQQQQGGNNNNSININQGNHENQHLMQPQQVQQEPQAQMGMGGGGAVGAQQIRPNSMAERARQLKIPPPGAPLKCPRCDSSNTKFCYYNNYNLTQPRHFCKACRRYWTRGGALRNVPVGGGCRRNKRSSSKSSSGGVGSGGGGGGGPSRSSLSSPTPTPTPIVGGERHSMNMVNSSGLNISSALNGISSGGSSSFMASLQNIAQLGGMGSMGFAAFGSSLHAPGNPLGGLSALTGAAVDGGGGSSDHAYHTDFPQLNHVRFPNFLGGFEIPGSSTGGGGGGLYSSSFQNEDHQGGGAVAEDVDKRVNHLSKTSQLAPVKMEDAPAGLNFARQLMGVSSSPARESSAANNNQNQFDWGGNMTNNNAASAATSMWTDLSGLN